MLGKASISGIILEVFTKNKHGKYKDFFNI